MAVLYYVTYEVALHYVTFILVFLYCNFFLALISYLILVLNTFNLFTLCNTCHKPN